MHLLFPLLACRRTQRALPMPRLEPATLAPGRCSRLMVVGLDTWARLSMRAAAVAETMQLTGDYCICPKEIRGKAISCNEICRSVEALGG